MYCGKVEISGINTAKLKVLSDEEKEEFLKRTKAGDKSAREELICGNLRLVLSIIQRFGGRKESADDLFQVGCIGLIKAIDNFNIDVGVKFSTYAVPMIIGEIRRYLRDNNAIRISRSMRDLAYRALGAREELSREKQVDPTPDEIAAKLGENRESVVRAMEAIVEPISLYEPVPTYLTNSEDVNIYSDMNAYVVLSSEISSQELIDLSKQINKKTIVDLFGQNACFYSRRLLLTNYFLYRNIDKDPSKATYQVVEELREDFLPIIEDETGTRILEPFNHCLCEEIKELSNVEYGIIMLRNFKNCDAEIVVKAYNALVDDENADSFYKLMAENNIKVYKGAYNIKSVLLKGGASLE